MMKAHEGIKGLTKIFGVHGVERHILVHPGRHCATFGVHSLPIFSLGEVRKQSHELPYLVALLNKTSYNLIYYDP